MQPELLGSFLNAIQASGRKRPIALVLAGTPGLEDTLRSSDASFWSRGERLRVGRLSKEEATRTVAEPFKAADIEMDGDNACQIAEAAEQYPYFLQLYGKAVREALEKSGTRQLRLEHVKEALRAGNLERMDCYAERYEEFRIHDALELARTVALIFGSSGGTLKDEELQAVIAAAPAGRTDDKQGFLRTRGYIWKAREGSWEPGIPSLMDHIVMSANDPALPLT